MNIVELSRVGIASRAMSCCDKPSMSAKYKTEKLHKFKFQNDKQRRSRMVEIINGSGSCFLSNRKRNYNMILEDFWVFYSGKKDCIELLMFCLEIRRFNRTIFCVSANDEHMWSRRDSFAKSGLRKSRAEWKQFINYRRNNFSRKVCLNEDRRDINCTNIAAESR